MSETADIIATLHNAGLAAKSAAVAKAEKAEVATKDMHAAGREAGAQFNKGNGALRRYVSDCKTAVGYHQTQAATSAQISALREYQTDAYIGAMADHIAKGGKVTAALLAEATAIVTVRKGYSSQAQSTDDRRTHEQHKVMGRVRQAWSIAAKELGLPALSGSGGAHNTSAHDIDATKEQIMAQADKAKVASFGFTKTTAPAVFAEGVAALCTKYVNEQGAGLTGDYGSLIRNFAADVAKLRSSEAKA